MTSGTFIYACSPQTLTVGCATCAALPAKHSPPSAQSKGTKYTHVGWEDKKRRVRGKVKLCLTDLTAAAASDVIVFHVFSPQPGGFSSGVFFRHFYTLYSTSFISLPLIPCLPHPSPYQHVVADFLEFSLDLHTVFASHLLFLIVPVRLLLDAGDDAPG